MLNKRFRYLFSIFLTGSITFILQSQLCFGISKFTAGFLLLNVLPLQQHFGHLNLGVEGADETTFNIINLDRQKSKEDFSLTGRPEWTTTPNELIDYIITTHEDDESKFGTTLDLVYRTNYNPIGILPVGSKDGDTIHDNFSQLFKNFIEFNPSELNDMTSNPSERTVISFGTFAIRSLSVQEENSEYSLTPEGTMKFAVNFEFEGETYSLRQYSLGNQLTSISTRMDQISQQLQKAFHEDIPEILGDRLPSDENQRKEVMKEIASTITFVDPTRADSFSEEFYL